TIGIYTPLYSISLFLPTIVGNILERTQGKDYNPNTAQLMTVPPYVAACIATIVGGYLADRYKERGRYMIFFEVVAIIGFVMLIASDNYYVQYAGTFFGK